eukprot:gene34663-45335_t
MRWRRVLDLLRGACAADDDDIPYTHTRAVWGLPPPPGPSVRSAGKPAEGAMTQLAQGTRCRHRRISPIPIRGDSRRGQELSGNIGNP